MEEKNEKKDKLAKVKELPITGVAKMESGANGTFLVMIMDNPFSGKTMDELRLTFVKPGRKDKRGNPEDDRTGKKNKGMFEYFLNEMPDPKAGVKFEGLITYREFKNWDDLIDFVCIEIKSPFPDFKENEMLRVYIQKAETQGVFEFFAKQRLELLVKAK